MTYALQAALDYSKRGFSVIPITWKREEPNKMKKPLVGWREWEHRRADETQIRAWWKLWPNAGVAIVTGKISGIVVMDADIYKGATIEGLPPTTMIANTGGGGQHHFYKYIEGARNRAGANGMDVRAEGGYVVAPPSMHVSGTPYSWDPDEEPGNITIQEMVDLSPTKSDLEKLKAPAVGPGTQSPMFERKTWLLDAATDGMNEGGRNDGVARLAGYYAGKGLPYDLTLKHCVDANAESKPPLDHDEVVRTVQSICNSEARKQAGETKPAPLKPGQIPVDDNEELEFIGFDDYAEKYGGKETQWLLPGFVTDCTIGFFVGPPGSYKTWGELDMAVSIAEGLPFLGHVMPERTGTVMMFQQEDSHTTISERIATIWAGRVGLKKPKIIDGVFTWECHEKKSNIQIYEKRSFRFDNPNAMANLEKMLIKYKPVVIFMDPFYSLVPIDDNMEKAASYMFGLKLLRDTYNVSFFMVHHTNKSSLGSSGRGGMWGSQFLNAFLETRFDFHNIAGCPSSIVMQRRSKDGGPKDPIRVDFDIFDATSDTPGEWRFNTQVTDIDERRMKELINPDRDFDDNEGGPTKKKYPKRKPASAPARAPLAVVPQDQQVKEEAIFKIVASGKLGPMNIDKLEAPLRDVFDSIYNAGRIRLSDDLKTYHKVLTLSVSSSR